MLIAGTEATHDVEEITAGSKVHIQNTTVFVTRYIEFIGILESSDSILADS